MSTQKLLERAKRSGYVRVQVDGSVYELTEEIKLDKNKKHNIEIVVDRLVVKPGIEKRLTDSIENVLKSGGRAYDRGCDRRGAGAVFSQSFSCPDCGISIDEIEPQKLFFQQSVRCLPGMFRIGLQDGI